jgi:hypothetical protein
LVTKSATACDNSTCPPCAAFMMRAVRLTTLPKKSLSRLDGAHVQATADPNGTPSVAVGSRNADCSDRARSASDGSSNAAYMLPPVIFTTVPWLASTQVRHSKS